MRALYFTDIHLSITPPPMRSTTPFYEVAFSKIRSLVEETKPHCIICGGDLFTRRDRGLPRPPTGLLLALNQFIEALGVPWTIVPGNHDVVECSPNDAAYRDDSPLALLESELVHVAWDWGWSSHVGRGVEFYPYGTDLSVNTHLGVEIAVLHQAFAPSTFDPANQPPSDLKALFPNAWLCLLGHIHSQYDLTIDGLRIINPGPLVRRSRDEIALVPCGLLVDTDARTVKYIPCGINDDILPEVLDGSGKHAIDTSALVSSQVSVEPIDDTNAPKLLAEFMGKRRDAGVYEEVVRLIRES